MTLNTSTPAQTTSLSSSLYGLLMNGCGAIAAIIFGLMSLLVGFDVIFRNLNIDLIPASVEITEYMLMIATFIAAPWLLYKGEHIRIDVMLNLLPKSVATLLDFISNVIGLIVCSTLAWQAFIVLSDFYGQGSVVFKELIFPEWWLSVPLLIGSFLLSVEFLRRLALTFHKSQQG